MAFAASEIENGDGSNAATAIVYANAESSDPLADALAYLTGIGKIALDSLAGTLGSRPKQEVHLIRGVNYVERRARSRILSTPTYAFQRLLQPRLSLVIDGVLVVSTAIHHLWLEAGWEAAELSAAGEALGDVVEDEGALKSKTLVGVKKEEWFSGQRNAKTYRAVDDLIVPFLRPLGATMRG